MFESVSVSKGMFSGIRINSLRKVSKMAFITGLFLTPLKFSTESGVRFRGRGISSAAKDAAAWSTNWVRFEGWISSFICTAQRTVSAASISLAVKNPLAGAGTNE